MFSENGQWELLKARGKSPTPRAYHSMLALPGGNQILVYGGKGPLGTIDQSDNLKYGYLISHPSRMTFRLRFVFISEFMM